MSSPRSGGDVRNLREPLHARYVDVVRDAFWKKGVPRGSLKGTTDTECPGLRNGVERASFGHEHLG